MEYISNKTHYDKKGTTMAKDMITKIMDVYNSKDRYDVMDGLLRLTVVGLAMTNV